MRIQELMTKPAVTCTAEDSLAHAARLMWDHDCGFLPVVDDQQRVIGVVTDRDGFMAAWFRSCPPQTVCVGDVMSRNVLTCSPADDVDSAERAMSSRQVRRIPVVDDGRHVVGIVSMNDLARISLRPSARTDPALSATHVAATLAAIGEPHHHVPQATQAAE